MLYRILQSAGFCVGLAVSAPVFADVTISSSNDPTVEIGSSMSRLIGAEHSGLSAIETARLRQLVSPVAPKVSLIPERKPIPVTRTASWLSKQPVAKGGPAWRCLAEALYFEARGESVPGQFAVAEVILNRVDSARYPDSVCAVINQGNGKKYQWQFTYTCDGHAEHISEPKAFERVGKVARLMLDGAARSLTNGATHYHTQSVNPAWASVYPRTATIGYHHFYKQIRRN